MQARSLNSIPARIRPPLTSTPPECPRVPEYSPPAPTAPLIRPDRTTLHLQQRPQRRPGRLLAGEGAGVLVQL